MTLQSKALDILQDMNKQRKLNFQNISTYRKIVSSKRYHCTNSIPNYFSTVKTDPMLFSHNNICWRLIDCVINKEWETFPEYLADFLKIYNPTKYEAVYRYLVTMMLHYPDRDAKDIATCLQLCFGCREKMKEEVLLKEMLTFPEQGYPLDENPTKNRAILKTISRKSKRKKVKVED